MVVEKAGRKRKILEKSWERGRFKSPERWTSLEECCCVSWHIYGMAQYTCFQPNPSGSIMSHTHAHALTHARTLALFQIIQCKFRLISQWLFSTRVSSNTKPSVVTENIRWRRGWVWRRGLNEVFWDLQWKVKHLKEPIQRMVLAGTCWDIISIKPLSCWHP